MAFYDRQYTCFLILGNPEIAPVWRWDRWQLFAAIVDPIVGLARDRALVRSGQFYKATRKEVKFGRLGWSARQHEKWVHESPNTKEKSQEWEFFFVEACAPSLPQCVREGTPPDVFLALTNEGYVTRRIPLLFNPRVFLAVAEEIATKAESNIQRVIDDTSRLLEAKMVATIRRPWGFKEGAGWYAHAIQDIAVVGLFKVGEYHSRPLDLATFYEQWQIVKDPT